MPQNTVNTPIITANVGKFPFVNKKIIKKVEKMYKTTTIFQL